MYKGGATAAMKLMEKRGGGECAEIEKRGRDGLSGHTYAERTGHDGPYPFYRRVSGARERVQPRENSFKKR